MTLQPVKSTNIEQYGYEDGVLEVHFTTGGIYRYRGVPVDVVEQFQHADSQGSFFHHHIREHYQWEKIA